MTRVHPRRRESPSARMAWNLPRQPARATHTLHRRPPPGTSSRPFQPWTSIASVTMRPSGVSSTGKAFLPATTRDGDDTISRH